MAGLVIPFQYKNNFELMDIVLTLYAQTELKTELSDTERAMLREYIVNGYNDKTKKSLITTLFLCKESDKKDQQDKLKAFNNVFKTKYKSLQEVENHLLINDESEKKLIFLKEYDSVRRKRASSNLNALNYTLKKKGFLEPHSTNQRLKIVSAKLMNLRTIFLETTDEKKCLIINLIQSTSKKT